MPQIMQRFILNTKGAEVRRDTMQGREYLVAPMVMMTVGVHEGSQGRVFYPEEEMSKTPEVWNSKPIVIYHPELDGNGISACDPDILTTQGVGVIMKTRYEDEKWPAEAWFDIERLKQVDIRVFETLERKQPMDVSTGLFADHEKTPGEWRNEKYDTIGRNLRPDHLAVLPDRIGACSLADGAGLLMNNSVPKMLLPITTNDMSHGKIRRGVQAALDKTRTGTVSSAGGAGPAPTGMYDAYVEDIYDKFFVYTSPDGSMYRQDYEFNHGTGDATIKGKPQQVKRVTEYRTADGAFVGNATSGVSIKESIMATKVKVDHLIANSAGVWVEKDRESLMGLSDEQLDRIQKAEDAKKIVPPPEKTPPVAPVVNNGAPVPAAPVVQTMDQYIQNAPPGIRESLALGVQSYNAEKAGLITTITANAANTFTVEELNAKDVPELRKFAKLVGATLPVVNYSGAQGGMPPTPPPPVTQTPLKTPKMDFSTKS